MPDFSSARHKLDRAHEHLEALHREIGGWLETKPYVVSVGAMSFPFDKSAPRQFKFEVEEAAAPPASFSLILGDVLTNLRGSLDHVAWEIATSHPDWPDSLPPKEQPWITFPLSKKSYRKTSLFRYALPSYREAIQRHQPCDRGYAPETHLLLILSRLVNIDKHKTLNPLVASLHELPPEVSAPLGGTIHKIEHVPGTRLKEEAHIADVWITNEGMATVDVDRIAVAISFGDVDPVRLPVFTDIADEVASVIADCETANL